MIRFALQQRKPKMQHKDAFDKVFLHSPKLVLYYMLFPSRKSCTYIDVHLYILRWFQVLYLE